MSMEYLVHYGHVNDPQDLTSLTVPEDECVVELAAVCRQCKQETKTHLSREDYTRLRQQKRDDWALGFWQYRGWEVSAGLCETCYGIIKGVQAALSA